ncbi:uncharacterized protein LOC135336586 isoform X2 [Halichondria panicea]|uniref:uncharacterized protein LOC135336586 isoform X2 n=1 Tax=Halichondria panicea TaxID=6063 RepID=UPI00312B5A4D
MQSGPGTEGPTSEDILNLSPLAAVLPSTLIPVLGLCAAMIGIIFYILSSTPFLGSPPCTEAISLASNGRHSLFSRSRCNEVTVQQPSGIVVSDSIVLENRLHSQNVIGEKSSTPSTPSAESYSGHFKFHPSIRTRSHSPRIHHLPPPTQTCQDPPPTQHTRIKSCHSDSDGLINVHPHIASKMPKSKSCHDPFNYGLHPNSMVIHTTTRLSGTNLSQQSSLASHTPIQVVSGASSPASKRGSIIRQVIVSTRSSLSGHLIASEHVTSV